MPSELDFSAIAHQYHALCNPLSDAKADQLVALLHLPPQARVLDVGCGKGEMLIRILERYEVTGVGLDLSLSLITEAHQRAQGRILAENLELQVIDAMDYLAPAPAFFDLALCLGATGAYQGYRGTLQAFHYLVKPGGLALIGEGFMQTDPDPEFLAFLGASPEEVRSHGDNVALALAEGWIPLYTATSNQDEWDHYEGLYWMGIERYVLAHPQDPRGSEMLARIRRWKEGYFRWTRDTLGMGFYLLQKPLTPRAESPF